MMRLLRAALFLEFGLLLIVVPWSSYWDRNYFAALLPEVRPFLINNFVRGAVSGLGVINLIAGFSELLAVYTARDSAPLSIGSSPAKD
jgi:hypothetical protein